MLLLLFPSSFFPEIKQKEKTSECVPSVSFLLFMFSNKCLLNELARVDVIKLYLILRQFFYTCSYTLSFQPFLFAFWPHLL